MCVCVCVFFICVWIHIYIYNMCMLNRKSIKMYRKLNIEKKQIIIKMSKKLNLKLLKLFQNINKNDSTNLYIAIILNKTDINSLLRT